MLIQKIKNILKIWKIRFMVKSYSVEPDEYFRGLYEYCDKILHDKLTIEGVDPIYERKFSEYMQKCPSLSRKDIARVILNTLAKCYRSLRKENK